MEIQEKRSRLIERLSNVENEVVLDEIEKILNQEDNVDFDFEKEWENAISGDELMIIMKEKIKAWPWKK